MIEALPQWQLSDSESVSGVIRIRLSPADIPASCGVRSHADHHWALLIPNGFAFTQQAHGHTRSDPTTLQLSLPPKAKLVQYPSVSSEFVTILAVEVKK
jgi:hypothetical protein